MMISASRRTDIPCYYSDWLINRLEAGYVLTRNPMNNAQLSYIPLSSDVVDCIVFWTKDARNIMEKLSRFDGLGYKYYFQFTVTPYDRTIERNLRDKSEIEDTFIELSKRIGRERVIWRYDPIILNSIFDIAYHKQQFQRMCEKFADYTEMVTISFVDRYPKLKTHLVQHIADEEIEALSAFLGSMAKTYGLRVSACCENMDLSGYGIEKASCIDKVIIEKVCGAYINTRPDKNQRTGCGCLQSIDIGAYNTCLNGCIYCYANNSLSLCERRHRSHNPYNELLIGSVLEGEKMSHREAKSDLVKTETIS